MNIKEVGLTALAASLVSVSTCWCVSVSGAASMNMEGYSGETLNWNNFLNGKPITFTGSGELDNGLNVFIIYNRPR